MYCKFKGDHRPTQITVRGWLEVDLWTWLKMRNLKHWVWRVDRIFCSEFREPLFAPQTTRCIRCKLFAGESLAWRIRILFKQDAGTGDKPADLEEAGLHMFALGSALIPTGFWVPLIVATRIASKQDQLEDLPPGWEKHFDASQSAWHLWRHEMRFQGKHGG